MRALILFALAAPALLANGNSATANAFVNVNVVAPVKLIAQGDINFGTIVVDDFNTASSVTMVPDNGGNATFKDWNKCAAYTGSTHPTAAFFHYQKDNTQDVNVYVDHTVNLTKGAKLTPASDMPADNCTIFINPTGVSSKHFAVAGKLDIPAGVIGHLQGLVNVTVSYK